MVIDMPQLCEIQSCTGCSACANACLQGCIHMNPDSEGFLRPEIQESACIHCGLCEKSCPVLHAVGQWGPESAKTKENRSDNIGYFADDVIYYIAVKCKF